MRRTTNILTAIAGEYYVAYWLAVRGFNVAMVRGLSPSIDLLVTTEDGSRSVAIQVKTSRNAHREFTKAPNRNRSEWEVTWPLRGKPSRSFLYAFVDLRVGTGLQPEVFIVPSLELQEVMQAIAPEGDWWRPFIWSQDDGKLGDPQWQSINRRAYLENSTIVSEALTETAYNAN